MNTTEDEMKKSDTRPTALEEIRIASLEEEVAEWRKAADSFRRERDTSDAVLAAVEATLPPPEGDDGGLASRVRRVVEDRERARTRADARDSLLAEIDAAIPGPGGTLQRVRVLATEYDFFRKLTDDAHELLTDASIPYGPLPERVTAIVARCETIAATSAPSDPLPLSPRDRNTLAPLLDLLELQVSASRGSLLVLAAVRAVVGVERG